MVSASKYDTEVAFLTCKKALVGPILLEIPLGVHVVAVKLNIDEEPIAAA